MRRILRFQASDDGRLLLEVDTLAFRLHAGYELRGQELGVSAGTRVSIQLLDDSDHLLDRRTYVVAAPDRQPPSRKPRHNLDTDGPIHVLRQRDAAIPTAR